MSSDNEILQTNRIQRVDDGDQIINSDFVHNGIRTTHVINPSSYLKDYKVTIVNANNRNTLNDKYPIYSFMHYEVTCF